MQTLRLFYRQTTLIWNGLSKREKILYGLPSDADDLSDVDGVNAALPWPECNRRILYRFAAALHEDGQHHIGQVKSIWYLPDIFLQHTPLHEPEWCVGIGDPPSEDAKQHKL